MLCASQKALDTICTSTYDTFIVRIEYEEPIRYSYALNSIALNYWN